MSFAVRGIISMNKNVLIVLVGGVVIAVLVAVLVQASLGKRKAPVEQEAKVEVLVAAADLKTGHELTEADLRWQSWPKGAVFAGAIVREGDQKALDAISGKLSRDIAADEPILPTVTVKDSGNFLAAALKPGMRAVAIEVKAETSVGGFVGPGDFVDVIMTYKISISPADGEDVLAKQVIDQNIDDLASETILRNIRVLAVDQTTRREGDKVKVGKTVTVEVTEEGAERVALASKMGDIYLALRGLGDDSAPSPMTRWPVVTDARMTQIGEEVAKEISDAKKVLGIRNNVVRVYSGDKVQDVPAR